MTTAPNLVVTPTNRLFGVGGWLMVLCISLTFLAPFYHLKIAATAFKSLLYSGSLGQGSLVRLDAVAVIYSGLAIFSCICGYMLWSENPRAPVITKAYLVIAAGLVIGLHSVLTLAGMRIDLFKIILARLVWAVCWYAYLSTSVRVQQTYAQVRSHDPITSATPAPSDVGAP